MSAKRTLAERAPIAEIPVSEHGVPRWNAHQARAFAERVRWDDLRAYLAVCDAMSFRSAANSTALAVNTLRRRVERLELEVGAPLLRRDVNGVTLTDIGSQVLSVAREMQASTDYGRGDGHGDLLIRPGEVRIGCTEGLGTFWLTPRLITLQDQFPDLTISLQQTYDAGADQSRDVDIGLTFTKPQNPELVRMRVAVLHFMLFASQDYLRRNGAPTSFADLRDNHRFIEQAGPGINSELGAHFFGAELPPGFLTIRSNSALSVYWAVIHGAGIGAFPTYTRAISKELIPITIPAHLRFDLWLYYHVSARNSPSIRKTVEWVKAAFDEEEYPWFADEFVHPDDFPGQDRQASVIRLYEDMTPRVQYPPGVLPGRTN
jgi:DNA-binding transcriptional LysR family regulator